MRSSTEYNKEFKEKTDYYDSLFREKLKNALKYRKITQLDFATLCNKKSQNATNKWLTQNAKYKTTPSAPELLAIADLLEFKMQYFYTPGITCEEADKTLSPEEKMKYLLKHDRLFVETSITNKVFAFLDKAAIEVGVRGIVTTHSNGLSTALNRYAEMNDKVFYLKRAHSLYLYVKKCMLNSSIYKINEIRIIFQGRKI